MCCDQVSTDVLWEGVNLVACLGILTLTPNPSPIKGEGLMPQRILTTEGTENALVDAFILRATHRVAPTADYYFGVH